MVQTFENKVMLRGVTIGGAIAPPHPPSPTSISEPNKVQKFQFQTSGISGGSEIIWTRYFTYLTVYTTFFGQFTVAFHFF